MRSRTTFLQANLIALEKTNHIAADLVFLRNVLIYFNRAEQDRIVRGVVSRLRPGGYLLTGHAEALGTMPPGARDGDEQRLPKGRPSMSAAPRRRLKVMIVDDSSAVREALAAIVAADPELEVCATASDPFMAAERLRASRARRHHRSTSRCRAWTGYLPQAS